MAKDKRVFTGGMDKDSDPRLIKNGDYRHAENIRNIASSDGTSGSVENIESTIKVPYSFKGEDVDQIIEIDEGTASVLPQKSVFYSQTITFEFKGREEDWGSKEKNSFSIYSYTPEKELEQIGHQWSSNGRLSWSQNSFKPTPEHLWEMFNEETGKISKNIPILDINTGEWETAHSKVDFLSSSFLRGGNKVTVEIIADKRGVSFLLDFISPGSDRYWSQTIEEFPPYGKMNLKGGPNSVVYETLVLSSQSSFNSEDTNNQTLDEFIDAEGNSFENNTPTPLEGDTITEYTFSFEGQEPTTAQDASEVQIFSYVENALGGFEVTPVLSFGGGLYNSGQTYEFNANQVSLSNSLHDTFEGFYGNVLHQGETAINGALDRSKGQVSLSFLKGEALNGNNFSTIQDSANASVNDFNFLKGFFNLESLEEYSEQANIEISNGNVTLTESSLANGDSWKFPVELKKNQAYLVQADISEFNVASAVLDVTIPSAQGGPDSIAPSSSNSDLSISGVNNTFEWIVPASEVYHDANFIEVKFTSGSIAEDETVVIKNLRVSKLKKSSFKFDISLRSLTDFNLCFGSSQEQVLESLEEGIALSNQQSFVEGFIISKLSLERKQGKDFSYVSDQLIEAQEKIVELNGVISSLNIDLKNLKTSYNDTLKDINGVLPLDGNVAFTLFSELENKSATLASTIIDVNTKVDDLVSKVTAFQTQEEITQIAGLNESIENLEADIAILNQASDVAAAQALIDIEAARDAGEASVTPEDGVSQADVDAVQALLDTAKNSLAAALLDVEGYNDGVTQVHVDAVQALLDQAGVDLGILEVKVSTLTTSQSTLTSQLTDEEAEVIRIQALLDAALANQEDGITQTDVNNAVAPIKALLTQAQTEINAVNPNDGLADTVVDSFQDLITTALATLTTKKEELTGVFDSTQTSSDIADINTSIAALQAEIVRLQGVETNQITQGDVDTAVTNLKDILVNASTVTLSESSLTSTDAATQALLDAISKEVTDASTIIADAVTKIDQQKQNAVTAAVSGLYTLTQLNEEYIKAYIKGTTLVVPEGGASQADTDGEIAAAIATAEQLIASGKLTSFTEGVNSVIQEDGINNFHIDNAKTSGYADGAASVDITKDNAAAYADGVDVVKNNPSAYSLYTQAQYEANFTDGVNSVDLTILGNPQIATIAGEKYAAGVTATQELFNNNLSIQLTPEQAENAGLVWAQGIRDGYFGEGVNSVDITSDNTAAYADGEAAGKILGAASVDLTVNNPAIKLISDSAFTAGANSVTPEDGIKQADVDAVQAKLDSLNSLISALPDSYTDSASITNSITAIETSVENVVAVKKSFTDSLLAAFNAGEASVDITTDNQSAIDGAVAKIDTALTNAKTDLKILESDLTVITEGTKNALQSLLDVANQQITNAENATTLVQADLDAIEASLSAANLLLDATVVKTDSETGEIINNTQASLDAVIAELADLKNQLFGFDAEKYANVQAQVDAAVAAATDTMSSAVAAAIAAAVSIQQPSTGITTSNINTAIDAAIATIVPDDGITQAEVDAARAAGAASITPEDGISQTDVDDAVTAAILAFAGPNATFTQANIDDAVRNATILITPEDGVTQDNVDAVQASLETAISTLRAALGLSADAPADTAADISALETKIGQLNAAQSALNALDTSASTTGGETIGDAAALIADYNTLKLSENALQSQIDDITALLASTTGTFAAGEGVSSLVDDTIQETIETLKTANSTLTTLMTTTGSSIETVSGTVTTLYNNAQLVTDAEKYISSLIMSTTLSDTTGIGFDSTTNLYNDPGVDSPSFGLEAGGLIGEIPQGFLDPIDPSTSTDLFYLLKRLTNTYNLLYNNYSTLYTDYTTLSNDPDTQVTQADVDAVQALLDASTDAESLANESLQLLYGNEPENYIGNGSFDNGTTAGWFNLYDGDNANKFWIIEDEKLVRSPHSDSESSGGARYIGSDASKDKRIQPGKYIVSVSLKSLGKGVEHDSDSLSVNISDTHANLLGILEVNGLGFSTTVLDIESVEDDVFFDLSFYFNGNLDLDFNLGVDDIQILKIPEQDYDQDTLNALITKLIIQQSIIDYDNLIATTGEEYASSLVTTNAASYADGAASVTPEDGVSQADVDAAVDAANLEFAASLISSLQRIALGFEDVANVRTLVLDGLVATDLNNWGHIQSLNLEELKDYIFNKIDESVDLGSYSEEQLLDMPEIENLVLNSNTLLSSQISELKTENALITTNFESDFSKFASLFSQALTSIETENNDAITEYVDTLSFAADYAGSTGVLTDKSFSNVARTINGTRLSGSSSIVISDYFAGEWVPGNSVFTENGSLVGVISSVTDASSTINLVSGTTFNLTNGSEVFSSKLNQLLTDGVAIDSIAEKGDLLFIKIGGTITEIGEVSKIENGPDVGSDADQRLITFKENISVNIPINTEILFNKLLNDLRDEFNVKSTSIEEFLSDILGQVSNLSNVDEGMGSLLEAYRFTLFGTPLKNIESLNNLGELKLLMRNPDVAGYEDWNADNYVVKIVDGNNNDYTDTNVVSTILGNHDEFANGESTASGGGNLTEEQNIASGSHFHYKIIPSDSDSLATILKLRFSFGSGDIISITEDDEGDGMSISNLDIVDIDGDDITNGYSFVLSIVKGASANKWEFTLSNDEDKSNVLNSQTVQWEIIEEEFDQTQQEVPGSKFVSDVNSNLSTITNVNDSAWIINEHTSGQSWAWNNNGYYEGVNGGVVSPEDGGGFNQSNSLSLPVPELKPNTTYEISFIKGTEFEGITENVIFDDWAVPNIIDLQDINTWEDNVSNYPTDYTPLSRGGENGTYWSTEEADGSDAATKVKVGIFNSDGTITVNTTALKTDFYRLRPVTIIQNAPASATVSSSYAGGIVIKRSGNTVKVVALSDAQHNFADTVILDATDTSIVNGSNTPVPTTLSSSSNSESFSINSYGNTLYTGGPTNKFQVKFHLDLDSSGKLDINSIPYESPLAFNPSAQTQELEISFKFAYEYTEGGTTKRYSGHFYLLVDATGISSIPELKNLIINRWNASSNLDDINYGGQSDLIKSGSQVRYYFGEGPDGVSPDNQNNQDYATFSTDNLIISSSTGGLDFVFVGNETNSFPPGSPTSPEKLILNSSKWFSGSVGTTYGLPSYEEADRYILTSPEGPTRVQFALSGWYFPELTFKITDIVYERDQFKGGGFFYSEFSALEDQVSKENLLDIPQFKKHPALSICQSYTSTVSVGVDGFCDLQISLDNGAKLGTGIQPNNNFVPDGFKNNFFKKSLLSTTARQLFFSSGISAEPIYNYTQSGVDYFVKDVTTTDGVFLRLVTSAFYDPEEEGAGHIVVKPKMDGFRGKFYGVQIQEFTTRAVNVEPSRRILSLLGEKIQEAETHNVINQSPVYGTALINAYNGNKTLMKNNTTGNVDVTPLIEGGYVCVGTYEDKPKNRIYYFVSEENKDKKRDSILEYDLMADKITTVYQDDVGCSSDNSNAILTFSESNLITGINKVDDILYFTDDLNRPRKINVELAKANEENISNPPYTFQDTFFRTFKSTVFVGGDNEHPFVAGDYIYTQYDSTSYLNKCFNGYAKVLGIVPKLNEGVTIAINKGETTVTLSSADHGLIGANKGDFLAITDGTLPHYYKIASVSGATVTLESPYNEPSKTAAKSLKVDGVSVSGIITDCPFGKSVATAQGKIFYANPKGAYSPLITFGNYEEKMKYFDVVKHQPTHKPSIEMVKESGVATNNIIDNVFQFKYRYNHTDEENTTYSPISDVAIDGSYATNAPINALDFNLVKNRIDVSYDNAISDVEFIEVVGRKGNDGKFFLIESIPNNFINYLKELKNDLILDSEDDYVIDRSNIKFYNNGVYPFIDELDSNKLFDAVPIKAKAQTILSNNRLAYGNIVEGYDNTDLAVRTIFSSEEAPILESQTSDVPFSPTIPSGYRENATGYDHKSGYGKATFNPTIDLNNIDLSSDKSQFLELDFNSKFKFETSNDLSGIFGNQKHEHRTSNFYGAWRVTGIRTAQELADFVVGQINIGDFVGGTGSKRYTNNTNKATVSASSNSSGQVTIRFAWTVPNSAGGGNIKDTKLEFKSQTIAGKFTSGVVGVGSFKSGAFHNFGIAYFDETNRCSFVNTAPVYSNVKISQESQGKEETTIDLNGTRAYNPFYTEPGGPDLGQGSNVSIEIYNQPPNWAKFYQIYYTGNNTVDEFVQMTVTRAEHGASGSGDDQMYLSLNSLKGQNYSYNQTNNSQVKYDFVPGDRIRFISCLKNSTRLKFNEYVDLEIAGEDLFQGTDNAIGDEGGYYIRINDPKNDAVKVVSNDGETTGTVDLSTTGSRNSEADSGYNGLIVEIYRPKKNSEEEFMVYYEVGKKYPIRNRMHNGDSSQGGSFSIDQASGVSVSETPAIVSINTGDIYLKPRTMFTSGNDTGSNAETFFPEDYNLNDFHNTNHYSKGRINVINTNSKARRLEASVYYSEPYSSTGSINGLSSFNLATQPYFDYNKAFGSIQSLQTKDDDLIIFHENKVGRVLVGKDVLNTASGDGLVSLSRDIIKNYVTVYSGDYGCCLQPESIVKNNDTFYFMDIKKGAVLRLSNDGITPISDNGMKDYFRDIGEMYVEYDPETQDNQVFNIVAGFDPKYNEYVITLPAVYDKTEGLWDSEVNIWNAKSDRYSNVKPDKIFFAKTVAFNEDINRWTSFYGFYPEFYSRVNNQFVGFQAGYLFKHNMTDRYHQKLYLNSPVLSKSNPNYNVCYDKVLDSSLEFPFNAEPDTVKNYNAISLNSDTKLFTEMKTNIGQTGAGEDNYGGYDNVISSGIGFRKVKGEIQSVNGKYLVGNTNSSIGEVCKFFEDLHKGDVIRIIGKKSSGDLRSFPSYAIVRSISSNSLLILNKELDLAVVSHVEVIDYKTKEGIQYSQIPFVSSMDFESETLGFNGDGSELSLAGSVSGFEYSDDPGVFVSIIVSNKLVYPGDDIPASRMITGAKYALIKVGENDKFNINNVSMGIDGGYKNLAGEVFTCSSQSSSTTTRVKSITDRAFIQNLDNGEIIFVGHPFLRVDSSEAQNKLRVSLSKEGKAFVSSNPTGNFVLFLAKDGNIEGERLKGGYMMTTLTTKSPNSTSKSDLPKYKFNLYSASVDVDKSELSGE